ncbi:hypothetical protein V6Z11_A11G224000 [Gossypium hirsutum]
MPNKLANPSSPNILAYTLASQRNWRISYHIIWHTLLLANLNFVRPKISALISRCDILGFLGMKFGSSLACLTFFFLFFSFCLFFPFFLHFSIDIFHFNFYLFVQLFNGNFILKKKWDFSLSLITNVNICGTSNNNANNRGSTRTRTQAKIIRVSQH